MDGFKDSTFPCNHVLHMGASAVAPHTNDELVGVDSSWCGMYKYFQLNCRELIFMGISTCICPG